jgi:hypothetical protein
MFTHWSAKVKAQISPAIKARLIRGAFYLLLLLGLCVIPFALAQRNATTSAMDAAKMSLAVGVSSSSEAPKAQGSPTPNPEATAIVVWDQYNNAGTAVTLSATFTDAPAMNSDLVDDFVVQSNPWLVQRIVVDGAYFNGTGPANSFNVFFYSDDGGFPGTVLYESTNIVDWTQNGSTFTIHLPSCCFPTLYPGKYWIEIRANMTAMCCGEWGWTDRTVTELDPAVWRNPSGFFGACTSWSRRAATCGLDPSAPDQVYAILAYVLPTATPITTPTATTTSTPTPTLTPSEAPCAAAGSEPACNSTVFTQVTDFAVYISGFVNSAPPPSVFTVNGIPADSASGGGSTVGFHFNASPVIPGQNTMNIPSGAFICSNSGRPFEGFHCNFTYQPSTPTPTPTPRVAPTARVRPTPPPRP